MKNIYLDNAATTPLDKEVLQAMLPYLEEHFGNPSSTHSFGRKTKTAIEQSRKTIAELLNVAPGEIFFTSGGTEADNMALTCAVRDLGIRHIITSPIEHHAVLHTANNLCGNNENIKLSYVNLTENGSVDLHHLERLITEHKGQSLVSLMHANNEIGNLIPIEEVADICVKHNAIFHSDTVQTMGHYPFDLQKLPIHFITGAAHKFHGPKGIGFLYISPKVNIKPILFGGSQERNMRGGTENLYGIVGLAKAMELAHKDMEDHHKHIQSLKSYMINELKEKIDGVRFNGDTNGLYTVLNVCFPKTDKAEMLLFSLDILGIAVSGGSACSSGSEQGSHVLAKLNRDHTRPAVRFSFSKYTTKEEIDYTLEKLVEIFEYHTVS